MSKQKRSSADHVDTHRRLLFLAMFLLSLIYAIKTSSYLIDGNAKSILAIVAKVIAVIAVITLILTVYWKLRYIPGKERYHLLNSTDSFVMSAMNGAFKTSWVLTILLINLILITTNRETSAFPTEFYLNLISFLMLASFSISFFATFQGWVKEKN